MTGEGEIAADEEQRRETKRDCVTERCMRIKVDLEKEKYEGKKDKGECAGIEVIKIKIMSSI